MATTPPGLHALLRRVWPAPETASVARSTPSAAAAAPVPAESRRPARVVALAIAHAIRPDQWIKNVLVFVPLLLAHRLHEVALVVLAAQAFVALSLCASAAYVVNDLRDVDADRRHPLKRRRPFAAGTLGWGHGAAIVGVALVATSLVASRLPGRFVVALVAYVVTTTLYTLVLKRLAVVDIFVLALLYVLRVLAGGLAVGVEVSAWLLALSLFFFQSLAALKRHAELGLLAPEDGRLAGREYTCADRAWLGTVGLLSGYLSAVVLALYISADAVAEHYARPEMLWPACVLLLFWVTRLWRRAYRNEVTDDSVGAVLGDPATYAVALGMATALVLAL